MRAALAALALLAGLTACGGDGSGGDPAGTPGEGPDAQLLVLAASSLTDAFGGLDDLAAQHHLDPEYSFAGSPVVLAQLEGGAPADVVAVADPTLLDPAQEALVFARNRLVVIAPRDSTLGAAADLARPGLRVVLAGPGVPAGRYARDALEAEGLLVDVLPNVVSEEADVRAVVAKVALGEADAGVVYATDASADERVRVVGDPLPGESAYAAFVPDDAPHREAGRRFLALLVSADAQRAFERLGFLPA